jgi:iron-sulfur cluster assembly accessory protein
MSIGRQPQIDGFSSLPIPSESVLLSEGGSESSGRRAHQKCWYVGTVRIDLDVGLASCVTMVLHQIPPNPAGGENTEMITVTPVATTKVKEIMGQQNPAPVALRVAVVGGGCSGFSYHMAFENSENPTDNVYEFDGLKIFVDQMSEMYLEGVSIDYIETLEGAGFKFNNPNVKSTCGCGSSFSV